MHSGCKKNLKLNKKQIERRGLWFGTSISEGCNYQEEISEGIKREMHRQYRRGEYSFSSEG